MSQSASNAFNKARSTQPEFRFEGNKQQHEVNRYVIGLLDRALDRKMRKPAISQRQGSTWGSQTSRPTWRDNLVLRSSGDEIVRCFRCPKLGHIPRECRSANARYIITGAAHGSQPQSQNCWGLSSIG